MVKDWTNCAAIQGFDRTKPIFDRTLSVDWPLFQALVLQSLSEECKTNEGPGGKRA